MAVVVVVVPGPSTCVVAVVAVVVVVSGDGPLVLGCWVVDVVVVCFGRVTMGTDLVVVDVVDVGLVVVPFGRRALPFPAVALRPPWSAPAGTASSRTKVPTARHAQRFTAPFYLNQMRW